MMRVSLSTETSVFLPSRGESSKFSVLVNRFADPRDPWVIADRIVGRINQDNLIVFVSRILQKKKEKGITMHQNMKSEIKCDNKWHACRYE